LELRRPNAMTARINRDRLLGRLETFNRIGALRGGGNCRLALSDEDRAGRTHVLRGKLTRRSARARSAPRPSCLF
jgi:hypothetical protein